MLGLHDQVWVTSVTSDADVQNALILCYSLKRVYTTRKLSVIVSPRISPELRQSLHHGFDFVFYLDENRNTTGLKWEDFAKIYSFLALSAFDNCAYLSPSMLAVKNADDIFDKKTDGFRFPENPADSSSLFLFKPSVKRFEALLIAMGSRNGTDFGTWLCKWAKNQHKKFGTLSGKYNVVMKAGKSLIGFEHDISIVNLSDYHDKSDIARLQTAAGGVLEKLVATHWLKIQSQDVLPLISPSTHTIQSSKTIGARYNKEPIAIVGMSCRFPNSNNLDEFWNLLFQGEDGTSNPPEFRWLREQCSMQVADARKENAGFLKVPVDEFDAKFFGLSPKEALFMDPQHRLLHEMVWEGLENACVDPHTLRGTCGSVFMGSWLNDYKDILNHSGDSDFYRLYMGNSIGAAAARISFLLGMIGPSIATESGCSSAMVALHLACKSLQLGETNLALACGVNLLLHPFNKDAMPMVLSPEGRCKSFSENADGFARAEGCGVLVLKRLSDAKKNGDHIWGLVRGSAISQEGVSKSMGTPTVHCESLAMKEALLDANVEPEQVSYVESHGTGTAVGDPMEMAAIAEAYHSPDRKEPLIVGSVKTNVGHTESCSGITGIIKVILAMRHEIIPAHKNFTKLNPAIDLDAIPAVLPLETIEWKKKMPVGGQPRIAGVSSFGITGTDAHVIIEEPPELSESKILAVDDATMHRPLHLLKLSAKTEEAMTTLLERYRDAIKTSKESIADIVHSANTGRANFPIRTTILGKNKDDICNAIEQHKYLKGEVKSEKAGKICFLFTGQGSQYPGMAKRLYDASPIFRMHFDHCEKILRDTYNISIVDVLWSSSSRDSSSSEISKTIYSQTSIFCVEYALLRLWESLGVKPDYALGHSLGEFGAAVCCGILSVEDAIKLVAERSRLINELPRGKMLVIKADLSHVENAMSKFACANKQKILDYAAFNSTQQTVVAGDSEVVLEFSRFLTETTNTKCIVLEATHAFHSKHMDPMLKKYENVAKSVQKQKTETKCEYISGMMGNLVTDPFVSIDASYWVKHTRDPVRFLNASRKAVELGCEIFIEIGPQPVLSALTMMNSDANLLCLPSLKKKEDEWSTILATLSKLYLKGVEINWSGLDQFYNRKKVSLPHYPFLGKKFWPNLAQSTGNVIHPLIGSAMPNASSTKLFQCGLNQRTHEYIKDHAIGHTVIFPGAGYLEMCLAAGLATVEGSIDSMNKPTRPMKVENLAIQAPLALDESKTTQLQTVVELNTSKDNGQDWNDMSVKIYHRVESEFQTNWLSHATATFSPLPTPEELIMSFDKNEFLETLTKASDKDMISQAYEKLASVGLKFGPVFQSLEHLWRNDTNNTLLAQVKVPTLEPSNAQSAQYIVHPAVLDAMIQAIMMQKLTKNLKRKLYVPIKIGKFIWLSNSLDNSTSKDRYIHVYDDLTASSGDHNDGLSTSTCHALLLDSFGTVLASMSGVQYIDTTVKTVESVLEQQTTSMPEMWDEVWRPQMGPAQYSHDLRECANTKFYTPEFFKSMKQKYNKLTPELDTIFKNLEKLVYYNILRFMYQCGFEFNLHKIFDKADLIKQFNIQSDFTKLFGYYLIVLEEEGILQQEQQQDSGRWKVISMPLSLDHLEQELCSPVFTVDLVKAFKPTLLYINLGNHLSSILQGKQSALNILFPEEAAKSETSSASDFYTDYGRLFRIAGLSQEIAKIDLEHCKGHSSGERTILRVLEVGAGTGFFTEVFLELASEMDVEIEFTFTDISSAFFPAAEKRFEKYLKYMTFKRLNIEEEPISQGFVPGYYDRIVTSDVIHATRNLNETLTNVRMLLKPGGRFDMLEMTKVHRFITFTFGLLDGFWRFEDFDVRQHHCTVTTEQWIGALETAGLSLIEAFPAINQHHAFICSTRKLKEGSETTSFQMSISPPYKKWLVFHQDDSPTSNFVLEKISTMTNRGAIVVRRGERFQKLNNDEFLIRPDSSEDFDQLISNVEKDENIFVEGVLYCWTLSRKEWGQQDILKPFFYLCQSMLRHHHKPGLKLIALTNGVAPVEDNDLTHFSSSSIWGFVKSLRNERSDLNCRCVDIGGETNERSESGMMQIFYELWSSGKETQVAFHGATRCVPKVTPLKLSLADLMLPLGTDKFQLVLPDSKSFSDLKFGPLADLLILGEKEVEIQVKCSALNFRDVFSVLKPSEAFKNIKSVGFDFAGVVKRTHPTVSQWRVGDNVFGVNILGDPLPSHIRLHEEDLLAVPDDMSFHEVCTLPAVVVTSYYCLIDVANIKASDTVLIHAATGGVGLSAIEICKHIGATIIATAGSKRKQNYLRNLGIQHIFHSRNTDYGDKILEVTNGRGVDVVLNSLTSEGFKEATLKACAPGARFVEISKLSVWQPEEVKKLRPDVDYTIVDVSTMKPTEWRRLMKILIKLLEDKVINPIPFVQFSGVNVREALQYLQKAKHIGKVVCNMPEVRQNNGSTQVHTPLFNARGTYLITGGLGGVGFEVCKWMVKMGAKYIVLAGRNPPTVSMQREISNLNVDHQTKIQTVQLNVSSFEQCKTLIQCRIPEMGYPHLKGVMHAAGTLHDSLIENQNWETLSSTFGTKIDGTLNLHHLTKDNSRLEHFVLFSSMAALLGSPGQSNHAAGNNFMDTFAHYRNSIGLPGTSINWGQWGEVGVATEVDLPGVKPFSNLQALSALEYCLKSQRVQTGVLNVESFVMLSKLYPHVSSYLDERVWKSTANSSSGPINLKSDEFWQQYESTENNEEKLDIVKDKLRSILRFILKLDDTDVIEDNGNFQEMGVDSLMFVEIKNALQSLFGDRITVNASALRDCNTVQLLAETLVKLIQGMSIESSKAPSAEQVAQLIQEDIFLPEHIRARPEQRNIYVQDISRVLVTGVTGTLGPYVLKELCKKSQITQITCVIRPKRNCTLEQRLHNILKERELLSEVDLSKVCCVSGNVSLPQLGMEPSVWEGLVNEIDAVFHCAASVQHIEYYRKQESEASMRSVNIGGLKNVLEFCCSGNKLKHVYNASTIIAVATVNEQGSLSEDWPQPEEYNGVTSFAYPVTKFVGDVIMREAVTNRGIPGKVFRFPLITGDSRTGRFILEQNHFMLRYIFIMKNGLMASSPFPVPMLPVDKCALMSVEIFFHPDAPDDIYNLSYPRGTVEQEFVSVAKRLGHTVDLVEFSEFSKKITEATSDDSPMAMFKDFYSNEEDVLSLFNTAPALKEWVSGEANLETFFLCRKSEKFIPELLKDQPELTMEYIYRDFLFAKQQGWLQKFGL